MNDEPSPNYQNMYLLLICLKINSFKDGFWDSHAKPKPRHFYNFTFIRSPPPINDADAEVSQTLLLKSV